MTDEPSFHLYGFPVIDWLNVSNPQDVSDPLSLRVYHNASIPHVTAAHGGIVLLANLLKRLDIKDATLAYKKFIEEAEKKNISDAPTTSDSSSSASASPAPPPSPVEESENEPKDDGWYSPYRRGYIHHTTLWQRQKKDEKDNNSKEYAYRLTQHGDCIKLFKSSEEGWLVDIDVPNDKKGILVTDTSEVFCHANVEEVMRRSHVPKYAHYLVRVYKNNILHLTDHPNLNSFLYDPKFMKPPKEIPAQLHPVFLDSMPSEPTLHKHILPITVLVNLRDLRNEKNIPSSLSWNLLAAQVYKAVCDTFIVEHYPTPSDGRSGKYIVQNVIVMVQREGAFIFQAKHDWMYEPEAKEPYKEPFNTLMVFDRNRQEEDFDRELGSSEVRVTGYSACMFASLCGLLSEKPYITSVLHPEARQDVKEIKYSTKRDEESDNQKIERGQREKLGEAVQRGLQMIRHLHETGYQATNDYPNPKLSFPYDEIKDVFKYEKAKEELAVFDYYGNKPDPLMPLLELVAENPDKYSGESKDSSNNNSSDNALLKIARKIILKGPNKGLPYVPVERVGDWRSADQGEIEGVRSVLRLIRKHRDLPERERERPLSIAVFGPPGAGKSFIVKQIAAAAKMDKQDVLSFNLSEFDSLKDLEHAFTQVRDKLLEGRIPLVFWDEFDSPFRGMPLGWLRYFLAPMQDSNYQAENAPRPIGKGIFVFAGGTAYNFEQFQQSVRESDRDAKKPDFISRLRAAINVKGPNPDHRFDLDKNRLMLDNAYIIRRAFLIHSRLSRSAKELLEQSDDTDIDTSLLDALLLSKRYRHGSRSLDAIVEMSIQNARTRLTASYLPSFLQLNMHTDADNLKQLLQISGDDVKVLLNPKEIVQTSATLHSFDFVVVRLANLEDLHKLEDVIYNERATLDGKWRLLVIRTHYIGEDRPTHVAATTQLDSVCASLEQEFGAEVVHLPAQISAGLAMRIADEAIKELRTANIGGK